MNVHEFDRYGRGVMVWTGITHDDTTPLHNFERSSITSQRYCREIILDHVCLFRGAVAPDLLIMEENAHPHSTVGVSHTLKSENIACIGWPAYFPDLNPTAWDAWDALGRRAFQRTQPPRTVQELKNVLREEWDNILQRHLNNLVDSTYNRCKICTIVRRGHFPY